MAYLVGTFWREVFDLSDAAQTPSRVRAGAQVSAALGVIALVATIVAGFTAGWSSTYVIILGGLVLFGASQSARLRYELRRTRRQRRSNQRSPSEPRCSGQSPETRDGA